MPTLGTKPASSTKRQHTTLVIAGRRRGFNLTEIRWMVGGSVRRLSASEASDWIERFTGRDLDHPPGKAPRTYRGQATPGTVRMITNTKIEQLTRLGLEAHNGDVGKFYDWLLRTYKVRRVRALLTDDCAERAITLLKQILTREGKHACAWEGGVMRNMGNLRRSVTRL